MRHVPAVALALSSLTAFAATTVWLTTVVIAHRDPCEVPAGAGTLDPQAQGVIARQAMACRDLDRGRITLADYRQLLGLDQPKAPPPVAWASSVLAVSSEWSPSQWSAQQVLGPPDVYPQSGDQPKAWASREADAGPEFIEVGFAQPHRIHQLQVYETYNPGAISRVELVTSSGRHIDISRAPAADGTTANVRKLEFACTSEPIVSARITLDSAAVAGWNELDAIGAVPCAQ